MPAFAANLTMMFTEHAFLDRFEAAAAAGFDAVEFLFPYAHSQDEIAALVARHGLKVALFNMPPGDWAAGERGMAAIPGREAEFAENARIALSYARALGTRHVHAMSGITRGLDPAACRATFISNMRMAADLFAPHGITILVEALNTRDVPGYFVAHQHDAAELCAAVDRPNLSVQLDLYHAQIMDGDLTRLIEALNGRFAHVQIASVPDRHEPDEGEVAYGHIFDLLDRIGYAGHVGCEYNPRGRTEDGLGWWRQRTGRP